MIITQNYTPDTPELLSWDELKIGDVYYHTCTKKVNIKTSKNSYVSFYDKKYHTRSKLLQGSRSKVFIQIFAAFVFSITTDPKSLALKINKSQEVLEYVRYGNKEGSKGRGSGQG